MDAIAEVISSPNIVFWVVNILALLSVVIIIRRPELALPIIFGWIAIVDLLKRLLWYDPNQSVPTLIYQAILAIPDILLIIAAIRVAFSLWVSRTLSFKPQLVDGLFALFFVWSFLNIFNPRLDSLYLGLVGFRSANLYILTYFIARLIPRDNLRALLRQLTIVIAAGTLFAVIYTFIQVQVGLHPFEVRWLTSGETIVANQDQVQGLFGTFRPVSTFSNHEQLGWWLGTSIVFLSALIRPTWLYLLIAAPAAFIIIRTLSRSSWAVTGASLAIVLILSFIIRARQQTARSVIIVAVLAVSFFVWTQLGASLTAVDELDIPSEGPGRTTIEPVETIQAIETTEAIATTELVTTSEPVETTRVVPTVSAVATAEAIATAEAVEAQNRASFVARATTTGTLEWRVFTVQALLGDPSWRTLLGNGIGSMWYAARFNVEGAILPTSVEVRTLGALNLPPGKRILSHIGLVDYIYELGVVGALIFLAGSATAIISMWRRLHTTSHSLARIVGFSFIAIVMAMLLVNSTFANTLSNARSVAVAFWGLLGLAVNVSLNTDVFGPVQSSSEPEVSKRVEQK